MYSLNDVWTVAQTIGAEARGEGELGMRAVAWVIVNRALDQRWPSGLSDVCKQPKQFSAWNRGDVNLTWIARAGFEDPTFQKAFAIAAEVLARMGEDPSNGANHYHADSIPCPWGDKFPTAVIGHHLFYRF